jgi:hypothetical protein
MKFKLTPNKRSSAPGNTTEKTDDSFVTPSTSSDTPPSSKLISRRAKRRLDVKEANPVVVEPVTCRKRKPSPLCVDRANELGPSTPGVSSPFDRMTMALEANKQLTPTEWKLVNKKMFDFDKGIENEKSTSQP